MTTWRIDGVPVSASLAEDLAEPRTGELALISDVGAVCAVVGNGVRAMVVVMDGPGDAGCHAVKPGASGSSGGYLLSNGQEDEYPDSDTVPWSTAVAAVCALVAGEPTPIEWQSHRID